MTDNEPPPKYNNDLSAGPDIKEPSHTASASVTTDRHPEKPIVVTLAHIGDGKLHLHGTHNSKLVKAHRDAIFLPDAISFWEIYRTLGARVERKFDIDLSADPRWSCRLVMSLEGEYVYINDEVSWEPCRAMVLQDQSKAKLSFVFSRFFARSFKGPAWEGQDEKPDKEGRGKRCIVQ